ncbi:MAG: hypothetical protein Ta2F_18890 [Termitinemataceae bacterium]|nr:MAG: hypothetical protein Ta2F_18890 [Termitinemataceae bacterium]
MCRSALRLRVFTNDTQRKELYDEVVKPVDQFLKIDKLEHKMTERMINETAFWGQNQSSFEQAEYIMRDILGHSITDSTIQKVTHSVGKKLFEENTKNAQEAFDNMIDIPYTHSKAGVLYIMIDGAAINTRKRFKADTSWRENKLIMVFNSNDLKLRSDGITMDILRKEYVSYIGNVEQFKKYVFECALRNGYGEYEKIVIVSDGASWIRSMCEELFPDAIQVLDYFHLVENINSYAKFLYGDDQKEYKPWAEKIIDHVNTGKIKELLETLEQYKDKKNRPDGIVNIYKYISDNRKKIDYSSYKKSGFYIGSGPVESANKTVLQKRCKGPGMMWDEYNAQYILTLRSQVESKIWVHYKKSA